LLAATVTKMTSDRVNFWAEFTRALGSGPRGRRFKSSRPDQLFPKTLASLVAMAVRDGLIPKIQKSFLSKDVDALQPHIRAFVERR
jgi:hypothetical protein